MCKNYKLSTENLRVSVKKRQLMVMNELKIIVKILLEFWEYGRKECSTGAFNVKPKL